jgi:ADP-ribosylglycohydrolase
LAARDIENRFLGSLLGLAIGDALGMPVGNMPVEDTRRSFGEVTSYLPRDAGTDQEIPAGEITDETETTLCIVESMTTNNGQVAVDNINARLLHLAEGASQHWMPPDLRDGIIAASDNDGVVPEDFKRPASLAAGMMGVPIGLMHSVGWLDRDAFDHDLRLITQLTNASDDQYCLTGQIASLIAGAIRGEDLTSQSGDEHTMDDLWQIVAEVTRNVSTASAFEEVVFEAVNTYRPADSAGALAGALAGVKFGASGIPQSLIDDLEARVYLTLAAPWFYKTAIRRAGLVIDLRQT